jgi:hypothetical protein
MIELLLGVSILINIFLVWYIVRLLKKFLNISEELENFFILLEEFSDHVDIVYKMERFFGDSTLENLMRHSKSASDSAKEFREIYDVNYENKELEDEDDEE